ncbi:O-antigen ligase family protein [Pedobacter sp. SD-b]|uniref:O-antigen ligase family protein n=1 Tax=Pedobacter segetis TaxID=2793069 RepID=A0ABS1BPQ4_9SPHI|nr:O-antigen ligase [Pedobacter segetis]MBK0384461.1 O-antigen ligase family protein [Pedobacter segetis]
MKNSFLKSAFIVVFTLIIGFTLLNLGLFYSPTFSALYGYVIGVSFLIFSVGLYIIYKKVLINLFTNVSLICSFVWLVYVIANKLILKNMSNLSIYYFSTCLFLFFSLIVAFQAKQNLVKPIFEIILSFAILESLICLLQYFKILNSKSNFFLVTGTWVNPNVTAMFLALVFPIGVYSIHKSKYKKLLVGILILLFLAIVILQCRTALIGISISTFIQLNYNYKIIEWLVNKKNRIAATLMMIVTFSLILNVSKSLYHSKQSSADGRKTIWKVAILMILEKPLTGYGYGSFERNYNLAQAHYIEKGKASGKELQQAGPVHMAYNELLQNTVEGGLIGLLLLLVTFVSILYIAYNKTILNFAINKKRDKEFIACRSALIAFAVMSMVNFTMQAIPVMCLFIFYCAIIISLFSHKNFTVRNNYPKVSTYTTGFIFMLLGLFSIINILSIAKADFNNKKAYEQLKQGHKNEALNTIKSIGEDLKHDSNYWRNYANVQASLGNYIAALTLLEKAKLLTSSPDVYLQAGHCYVRLKQYTKAVKEYQQSINLHPTRFAYRNALLQAYQFLGDRDKVVATAKDIIALKPKIPSVQVNNYKYAARNLMMQTNISQNTSTNQHLK